MELKEKELKEKKNDPVKPVNSDKLLEEYFNNKFEYESKGIFSFSIKMLSTKELMEVEKMVKEKINIDEVTQIELATIRTFMSVSACLTGYSKGNTNRELSGIPIKDKIDFLEDSHDIGDIEIDIIAQFYDDVRKAISEKITNGSIRNF